MAIGVSGITLEEVALRARATRRQLGTRFARELARARLLRGRARA